MLRFRLRLIKDVISHKRKPSNLFLDSLSNLIPDHRLDDPNAASIDNSSPLSPNQSPIVRDNFGSRDSVPAIISRAGSSALFAWDEFFFGRIRNPHTRRAYRHAVSDFLIWCGVREIPLTAISPMIVGRYFDEHTGSIATRKQHLAALRHFFDAMVSRHAIVLNPALSVRGERYSVLEGKTPEITRVQARLLLQSIDTENVVGLRDRGAIAVLIYTAARVGAVAKLRISDFYFAGDQWMLHFQDKGGKSREIPVRHDLQQFVAEYLDAAGIGGDAKDAPLFRSAFRRSKQLTERPVSANDLSRMLKRHLLAAGLPSRLSPHSFRVATITDLLTQGVPIEDVQHLAGHADARTTSLYDRRQKRVTRNVVERISI